MRVLLSQGAEGDVAAILSHYGEGSSKAIEFGQSLEDAILHLERFSETITRRRDLTRLDMFFWPFSSHWLVLKKRHEGLLGVGVHHCARRLAPPLKQDLGRYDD